jgi:hypothetical protein
MARRPPTRRKALPVGKQRTEIRHRFLAHVKAGYFALRFRYGGDSLLVLTREGQTALRRFHPHRGEQSAHRWATTEHRLLERKAGFDPDQLYSLHCHAEELLAQWNTTFGDPLADDTPKDGETR